MTDLIKSEKNKSILRLLDNLKSEFNVNSQDIISILIHAEKNFVPLEIFADRSLSVQQALVKFMKENLDMSNKEISDSLNKDPRSTWSAYEQSKSRMKIRFEIPHSIMPLPISIFKEKSSLLESIVLFLKNQSWQNHKIASTLNRSETTISTVYRRSENGK
ncbi:MAG: hypothetical protein WC471_00135 [Candidatus Woesearchaeota archaeon]|jgi:transcriptional regulator